jgi:Flp pilus assembly protein TadG
MPVKDRGSMAVEFVIAAPALVMMLLLIAFAGQWFNNTSQVGTAARDAARTASDIVDGLNVHDTAVTAAERDLSGACESDPTVTIKLLPIGADWVAAQTIEVTVSCTMSLDMFNYIGLSGSQTFSAVAYAPLDPYSYRTDG